MATSFVYLLILLFSFHRVESAAQATGADCDSSNDTCIDAQANCTGTTLGGTTCECNANYYDDSGNCTLGVDLNDDCSGVTSGLEDIACQAKNAQTTCITSGINSLCTCNSGYYDDDGTSTVGGSCVAGVDLNGDCSGATSGFEDTACQAKNAQTTCVTSGGNSLCTCNSGYYDEDGTGTMGGSCAAALPLNADCSGVAAAAQNEACSQGDAQATCVTANGASACTCNSGYYDSDGTSTAGGNCTVGLDLNADCSGVTEAAQDEACQALNAQTTCVTANGSSLCTCNSGYFDSDGTASAGGSCTAGVDLNGDCSGVTSGMEDTACQARNAQTTCVTADGSSLCTCDSGYYDDDGTGTMGGSCVAALTLNADCSGVAAAAQNESCSQGDAQATCATANGASVCTCNSGYYDSDGTSTAGGNCTVGLDLNADCSGVTEAAQDEACQALNAQTTCVTANGSSLCTCNSGYFDSNGTANAGGSCTAVLTSACIDETNCGDLDSNAECKGIVGSKTCNCKSGYTGGAGDVCSQNGAGLIMASFLPCISLVLLTAKSILL